MLRIVDASSVYILKAALVLIHSRYKSLAFESPVPVHLTLVMLMSSSCGAFSIVVAVAVVLIRLRMVTIFPCFFTSFSIIFLYPRCCGIVSVRWVQSALLSSIVFLLQGNEFFSISKRMFPKLIGRVLFTVAGGAAGRIGRTPSTQGGDKVLGL